MDGFVEREPAWALNRAAQPNTVIILAPSPSHRLDRHRTHLSARLRFLSWCRTFRRLRLRVCFEHHPPSRAGALPGPRASRATSVTGVFRAQGASARLPAAACSGFRTHTACGGFFGCSTGAGGLAAGDLPGLLLFPPCFAAGLGTVGVFSAGAFLPLPFFFPPRRVRFRFFSAVLSPSSAAFERSLAFFSASARSCSAMAARAASTLSSGFSGAAAAAGGGGWFWGLRLLWLAVRVALRLRRRLIRRGAPHHQLKSLGNRDWPVLVQHAVDHLQCVLRRDAVELVECFRNRFIRRESAVVVRGLGQGVGQFKVVRETLDVLAGTCPFSFRSSLRSRLLRRVRLVVGVVTRVGDPPLTRDVVCPASERVLGVCA